MLAWFANALCFLGCYLVGNRQRYGLLVGFASCAAWAVAAIIDWSSHSPQLLTVETVLGILNLRAWFLWGKTESQK